MFFPIKSIFPEIRYHINSYSTIFLFVKLLFLFNSCFISDEKEKQRKLDLLKYQFDEIEKAELKTEEEYELEEKRKIVMNSEKISQNLQEAEGLIADNGIDSISMAIRALEKIENIDEKYEKVSANLKFLQ